MKYYKVKGHNTYYKVYQDGFECIISGRDIYHGTGSWDFDQDDIFESISKEIYELNLLKIL